MAAELNSLFSDREVRAIFAFTGGRMTLSYLDLIDYDAIIADPKPLVGFSDISGPALAIHARTGLVAVHGDLVAHGVADWRGLGDAGRALSDVYRRVLMEVAPAGVLPRRGEWECWRQGWAEGPLIGGLLNRIIKLQSTAYRLEGRHFNGAILFWEDLGTTFSGVWNDLQALRQAGLLDRIAGMIVGPLSTIGRDEAGPASLREVVLEVLGDRPIPVIANVNIGHDPPNVPLPLGINARIDAAELSVSLTEAAVI